MSHVANHILLIMYIGKYAGFRAEETRLTFATTKLVWQVRVLAALRKERWRAASKKTLLLVVRFSLLHIRITSFEKKKQDI